MYPPAQAIPRATLGRIGLRDSMWYAQRLCIPFPRDSGAD